MHEYQRVQNVLKCITSNNFQSELINQTTHNLSSLHPLVICLQLESHISAWDLERGDTWESLGL